jgi:hypothetical protein
MNIEYIFNSDSYKKVCIYSDVCFIKKDFLRIKSRIYEMVFTSLF